MSAKLHASVLLGLVEVATKSSLAAIIFLPLVDMLKSVILSIVPASLTPCLNLGSFKCLSQPPKGAEKMEKLYSLGALEEEEGKRTAEETARKSISN